MITYKTEMKKVNIVDEVTCDRCKEKITEDEVDEMYSINFIGGYFSIFGDGNYVECDLCQKCLYELISGFCRYGGK